MATASDVNRELLKRVGDKVPLVGFGTFNAWADNELVAKAVEEAVDVGYRHFDCAYNYNNEKEIGAALQRLFKSGKVRREELFITSKLWHTFHRRDRVEAGLRETLANLQLDYVDLYLMHWPVAFTPESWGGEEPPTGKGSETCGKEGGGSFNYDLEDVPLKDTWQGMEACVDAGLCKAIGVSNFGTRQLRELLAYARIKPVAHEFELHPYLTQKSLVKFSQDNGLQVMAYSSLGRGPVFRCDGDPCLLEDPVVMRIANEVGRTPGHVLLRWAVQQGVSVIPKSLKRHRQVSNTEVGDFKLSNAQMAALDGLNRNLRFVRPKWHVFEDDLELEVEK